MNRDLLYEKAFRMKAAQPWKTLAAEQVFAFEIAERIYYVQMTEDMDTDKILRIYQDENDLKSCLAMLEHDACDRGSYVELKAQVFSQSTLIRALTSRDYLAEKDQEAVRAYAKDHGISLRGRYAWPQMQRLVSFQVPRKPDPEEENAMVESMEAVIWLSQHGKEAEIQVRKISSGTPWITLIRKTVDGYTAEDMGMPKLPETEIPAGENRNDVFQMKTKKMEKHGTWYCRLDVLSEPRTAEGVEGLYYAWELQTFDLDRERTVSVQAVRDYVHRTDVMLDKLMEAVFREKKCPKEIRVSDERTEKLLQSWCEAVGIRLSRGEMPEGLQEENAEAAENRDFGEMIKDVDALADLMQILPDEILLKNRNDLAEQKEYLEMMAVFPDVPASTREKIIKTAQRIEGLLNKAPAKRKKTKGKARRTPETSLVISVSLESGCYRHIQISNKATLEAFSDEILDAFEFFNDHGHAFFMDNRAYSDMDCYYMEGFEDGERTTGQYTLEQAGVIPGMKFKYVFDFGDDWTFQCRVLKELDEITARPRVIRSKGEPPEQYPDWEDEDWEDEDDDEDEDW